MVWAFVWAGTPGLPCDSLYSLKGDVPNWPCFTFETFLSLEMCSKFPNYQRMGVCLCFHDLLDINLPIFSLKYLYLPICLFVCQSVYLSDYQSTLRFSRPGKHSCESLLLAHIRDKINREPSFVRVGSDPVPSAFSGHADIILAQWTWVDAWYQTTKASFQVMWMKTMIR